MPHHAMTAAAAAARARAGLRAMADARRAAEVQRYFKDAVVSFGVPSPAVRSLAGELYAAVRKDWTVEHAVALADLLFPRPELEAKSVAALVLLRFHKDFPAALFRKTRAWLERDLLDNWASVDIFCPQALGTLLARYPELLTAIETWAIHPNRWVRRASLVAFLKLVKKEEYLDAAYRMAARHFDAGDDLVQKAAGWLLREAGKRDMRRLEKFLLANGPALPRTTLRYAIERFPEPRRRELLKRTRGRE